MADSADDVLDNWEDEDTEVLERRMEERQKQQDKEKKKKQQQLMKAAAAAQKNQGDLPPTPLEVQTHLPLRTQDVGRTEYVAPIKILKRQVDTKAESPSVHATNMSSVQRKSLAEREADYASARARILGTGYRSGEEGSSPTVAAKSSSPRGPGESLESVKRQPKGPNGTKGFKSKAKS